MFLAQLSGAEPLEIGNLTYFWEHFQGKHQLMQFSNFDHSVYVKTSGLSMDFLVNIIPNNKINELHIKMLNIVVLYTIDAIFS